MTYGSPRGEKLALPVHRTVRLFVALYPPPAVVGELTAVVSSLAMARPGPKGEPARLTPPDQWHLTLAFLGEVADDMVPAAAEAVDNATRILRTIDGGPLRLRLGGGGRFSGERSTVVWLGVGGDTAALQVLAVELRRQLRLAGLPYDQRPYQPHLTLARPAGWLAESDLRADLARLDAYESAEWPVDEVCLTRSRFPAQPPYEQIARFPIN